MVDNPTSLSEMLKSIVSGYDEIKSIHNQSILIEKNIFSVQVALENELKTSASYNERTKLKLDDINEKLASAKVFFDEIEQNQAQVKALFTSINNLVIKEAALIKNVDSKISNYTELNAKNTELLAEINTIKEAVILATKTYKNDCDLALKELNESLAKANALNESLATKDVELKNTLESIESARANCLQISNEIKEMRKRSQCLMSKAEEIFNKSTWFETTLNEYIAKIQTLENNYNLAFTKNEELELKIKDSIATLNKILLALNGRSLDEVLTELKTTNTTLQTAINTKAEIDTIKSNLEALLTEQKTKLDEYYTKLESDNLFDLTNEEVTKLQTNKADITELEPIKTDIVNLANTKANASDVYTKLQCDELLSLANDEIAKLQTNKADITELEPIKTDIVNLANTKANIGDLEPIKTDITNLSNDKANKIDVYNKSDVYTKLEADNLLKDKTNNTDLEPLKNSITSLTNNKANKTDVYTKTETNNIINAKVPLQFFTTDKTVTVGTTGANYTDLQKAIDDASNFISKNNAKYIIKIITPMTFTKTICIDNHKINNLHIFANDNLTHTAITDNCNEIITISNSIVSISNLTIVRKRPAGETLGASKATCLVVRDNSLCYIHINICNFKEAIQVFDSTVILAASIKLNLVSMALKDNMRGILAFNSKICSYGYDNTTQNEKWRRAIELQIQNTFYSMVMLHNSTFCVRQMRLTNCPARYFVFEIFYGSLLNTFSPILTNVTSLCFIAPNTITKNGIWFQN